MIKEKEDRAKQLEIKKKTEEEKEAPPLPAKEEKQDSSSENPNVSSSEDGLPVNNASPQKHNLRDPQELRQPVKEDSL